MKTALFFSMEASDPEKPGSTVPHFLFHMIFPLTFLYWEAFFSVCVFGAPVLTGLIPTALFSLGIGTAVQLFVSLFTGKVNRILRRAFLIILAVPYGVEYFVFKQFNVLYDVSTVLNGAGGVVTGFMGDALQLIFSLGGILFLFFLLLPALLYALLGHRRDLAEKLPLRPALIRLAAVLIFYTLGWGSVRLSPISWKIYNGEIYSFESASKYFGLFTGLDLDIRHIGSRQQTLEFEFLNKEIMQTPEPMPIAEPTQITEPTHFTEPTQITEPTAEETVSEQTPVTYGKNVLDLPLDDCSYANKNLAAYVNSLTPSSKNAYTGLFAGKNLIIITAEAFCANVIDPERTPTLHRLANSGFRFTDYYQPAGAGTTGGEVQNLLGLLPTEGGSTMMIATQHSVMNMATFLTPLGYSGGAFHNNDCTFYSRHLTHNRLGYPDGFMGIGSGMEEYVVNRFPQSDLEMLQGTLPKYLEQDQPFNLYYMTVSGHSIYSWINSSAQKHREEVADMELSEELKAYFACQLELEYALRYTVEALEEAGKANDTVICISSDHFPYGLTRNGMDNLSELYGYPIDTWLDRDYNRLILWSGCLENQEPVEISAPTSSLDILPTLCNLFGVDFDSRLMVGRDVFSDTMPLVFNLSYEWKTDLGSYTLTNGFVPASPDLQVPEGYVERINVMVKNKVNYCKGVINQNFFDEVLKDRNSANLGSAD